MTPPLAEAAARIAAARRVVALTGAGISVPSGIPDYRTPKSGVWANYDPARVANINAFGKDPRPFYTAYRELGRALLAAEPNPAHLALARLEQLGRLEAVCTQNIDSLHQAAGSRDVMELHGHLRTGRCLRCRKKVKFLPILERLVESGEVPYCNCHGVIKPDIVLFGETLPTSFARAQFLATQVDVLLCVGSSLQVYPVAELPLVTYRAGGSVIIVNREPTELDDLAAFALHGDVVDLLPALADQVATLLEADSPG